ncbi:hypothetical protein [Gracilinema caldarium]|uniref:DUF998 domain-containing protein n=1 Tax=Gracilinema caldarium (strain ATCC 51460 / DSM 7334 / H1) TaxID=744872 RepID=F8EXC8_GRAC1|nr:hypothetical protein [Gracilinema caldarium]AEJ19155.1 hypothetical protein Spica_1005 [Gracilinema caldarium DSM 7334]
MAVKRNKSIVISYKALRRLIGVLGMALPVVLILGGYLQPGNGILGSISSYYHSNMQDVFVGILWAVGLFLISYKGYDSIDNWVTNLSGLFAIGVALFPTIAHIDDTRPLGVFQLPPAISGTLHLAWAFLFFLLLAYNSYFLFTKTGTKIPGPQKLARNTIYRVCGIIIIASLAGIVLYMLFLQYTFLRHWAPVLILETLALWAFGFSWLVKGETLFRD